MGSLARSLAARFARPLGVAAVVLLLAAPVAANEITAVASGFGIRIHGAEETQRDWCSIDADGRVWLTVPGGRQFELLTSTLDAMVTNRGDGTFHPFDEAEVRAALAAVRYPLDGLDVEIFILPGPRRDALESGAGRGVILLSPGVVPLSAEQQHSEVVHELGHVVQYRWMPDGDPRWNEYRALRGIDDLTRYRASAVHADRPHEIFAEDFRALFGGSLANYSGSIENSTLAYPSQVAGLDAFLAALPAGGPAIAGLEILGAHPARGAVELASGSVPPQPLDLFDLAGRRIATLTPVVSGSNTRWSWSGADDSGRRVPAGVMLARVRGTTATARFSWLP